MIEQDRPAHSWTECGRGVIAIDTTTRYPNYSRIRLLSYCLAQCIHGQLMVITHLVHYQWSDSCTLKTVMNGRVCSVFQVLQNTMITSPSDSVMGMKLLLDQHYYWIKCFHLSNVQSVAPRIYLVLFLWALFQVNSIGDTSCTWTLSNLSLCSLSAILIHLTDMMIQGTR